MAGSAGPGVRVADRTGAAVTTTGRVRRVAARVILVDDRDRVLLVHGRAPARPDRPAWWITPGGGVDGGETVPEAARREVYEETGLRVDDLGPVVRQRTVAFHLDGREIEQEETFFLVRVGVAAELDTSGWNDLERRALTELRWWTPAELAARQEAVFPTDLLDLLQHNGIAAGRIEGC